MRSLGWGLNPIWLESLYEEDNAMWRHKDKQAHREEGHVITEAEIGVMQLQNKEHQGLWAPPEDSER